MRNAENFIWETIYDHEKKIDKKSKKKKKEEINMFQGVSLSKRK